MLSGEMARSLPLRGGVQRENRLAAPGLASHPPSPPSPQALSGPNYLASPPSTRTPGSGGPGLPAGSPLLASGFQLLSAGGVDGRKIAFGRCAVCLRDWVPGCSDQFSTADPIAPAPDDSSCRPECLFHQPRMGARTGNS